MRIISILLVAVYFIISIPSNTCAQAFLESPLMKWVGGTADVGGALQLLGAIYEGATKSTGPTIKIDKVTFKQPDKFYVGDERIVTVEFTANWVENPFHWTYMSQGKLVHYHRDYFGHYVQLNFYLDSVLLGTYRNDEPNYAIGDKTESKFTFSHVLEGRKVGAKQFSAKAIVRGRRKAPAWKQLFYANPDSSEIVETTVIIDNTLVEDPFGPPELVNNTGGIVHGGVALVDMLYNNSSSKPGILTGCVVRSGETSGDDATGTTTGYRNHGSLPPKQKIEVISKAQLPHDAPVHDEPSVYFVKGIAFSPKIILHDKETWEGQKKYFSFTSVLCDTTGKKPNGTLVVTNYTDSDKKPVERLLVVRKTQEKKLKRVGKPQHDPSSSDPVILRVTDLSDTTKSQVLNSDDSGRIFLAGLFGSLVSIIVYTSDFDTLRIDSLPTELINAGVLDTMVLYPTPLPKLTARTENQNAKAVGSAIYRVNATDTTYLGFYHDGKVALESLTKLDLNGKRLQLLFTPATGFNEFYQERTVIISADSIPTGIDSFDLGIITFNNYVPVRSDSLLVAGQVLRYLDSIKVEGLTKLKISFYDPATQKVLTSFTTDDSAVFLGMIPRKPLRMIVHVGDIFSTCIANDTVPVIDFTHSPDTMFINNIHYYIPCERAGVDHGKIKSKKNDHFYFRASRSFSPELVIDSRSNYTLYSMLGEGMATIRGEDIKGQLSNTFAVLPAGLYILRDNKDGAISTILSE